MLETIVEEFSLASGAADTDTRALADQPDLLALIADALFRAFDLNGDSAVSFEELILGLSTLARGFSRTSSHVTVEGSFASLKRFVSIVHLACRTHG